MPYPFLFIAFANILLTFSSPTMARCSAAKATGNPETNFMAAGDMSPQALYG